MAYVCLFPTLFALLQLRQTVFNLCQTDLTPFADQIDKDGDWPDQKVECFSCSWIELKILFSSPMTLIGGYWETGEGWGWVAEETALLHITPTSF